jgi:peptidoglycan L-alanyl-D-glutamate endopeptidase CwlK
MYKFGPTSQRRLDTCHPKLQEILNEAIKHVDFSVLCGHRNEADQTTAFQSENSKVQWPNSKHNSMPSRAVDIAPYPIDWEDLKRFAHLGGLIRGIAVVKGIKLRFGFDWDVDGDITDHKFMDWPHIELADDEE